jgi:hypothetical protein
VVVPTGINYQALIRHEIPNINKRPWKLKALLKVKCFCGISVEVILTKDNVARRYG